MCFPAQMTICDCAAVQTGAENGPQKCAPILSAVVHSSPLGLLRYRRAAPLLCLLNQASAHVNAEARQSPHFCLQTPRPNRRPKDLEVRRR